MENLVAAEQSSGPVGIRWNFSALAVLMAALILFLLSLGDRAVVSEEVRWAEVAREMKQSQQYFHPTINGHMYFDKPVGSYWLIVAVSSLTGEVNETSARLPAAIAGVIGVWVVMLLGRKLYDARTGPYAGAILATSFGFVFYSRRATADIETVTGVLVAIWLYVRHDGRPAGPWVIGLWVWMAAVSLTKGLLGFALPILVFSMDGILSAWMACRGRLTPIELATSIPTHNVWFFNRWTVAAVPLGLAAYAFPFWAAASQTGSGVGLEMVWRENVQRFVNPHNHTGPVTLYFGVIFVLAAPWSVFLPAALLPPSHSTTKGDRLVRVYFWVLFLFFTASASRRSYYLLPILPATSLLIARVLAAPPTELTRLASRLRQIGWCGFGIGGLLVPALLIPPGWFLPAPYHLLPPLPERSCLAVGWVLGVVVTVSVRWWRPQWRVAATMALLFIAFGFGFGIVYPKLDESRPRQEFLAHVRQLTDREPNRLGLLRSSDIVFDLRNTTPEFTTDSEVATAIAERRIRWLVVPRRHFPEFSLQATVVLEEVSLPWESTERLNNKLLLLDTVEQAAYPHVNGAP